MTCEVIVRVSASFLIDPDQTLFSKLCDSEFKVIWVPTFELVQQSRRNKSILRHFISYFFGNGHKFIEPFIHLQRYGANILIIED
jgi:hypothetical protein